MTKYQAATSNTGAALHVVQTGSGGTAISVYGSSNTSTSNGLVAYTLDNTQS